jgi:hypothetical protein
VLRLDNIDNLVCKLSGQINIRTHLIARMHLPLLIAIYLFFFALKCFHTRCGSSLIFSLA